MDTITISKTEYPDSLEIGTPGKGGVVKVYFNASNKEEAEQRLNVAVELRAKAQEATGIQNG